MDKNFLKVIMYLIICILAGSVVNESAQIFFLKNKNMNIIFTFLVYIIFFVSYCYAETETLEERKERIMRKSVSYTHLTLPTIYSV